jgi:hypothetical protein
MDANLGAESDSNEDVDQYADQEYQVEEMMKQAAEHRKEGMQDEDAALDYKCEFFLAPYTVMKLLPQLTSTTAHYSRA